MAGPGIRYLNFARELRDDGEVTLVVPFETDLEPDGFDLVVADVWDPALMTPLTDGADCVVAQRLPVPTMRRLARTRTRRIYDLYAPLHIENLALDARQGTDRQPAEAAELNRLADAVVLRTGDAFICASEMPARSLARRADAVGSHRPRALRGRPVAARADRRGAVRHLGRAAGGERTRTEGRRPRDRQHDRLLLWPGGIWNWFDPLTVIDAVAELARRRDDVRLFFLGLRHPNPHVPEMRMAARAAARAEELGLRDRVVFFHEGWIPYEQRGAYLLEADLGVSAHFDDIESRFAFRTRLLDCFWAGLPVVTTTGDVLGDLVERRGLGRRVAAARRRAPGSNALETLLDDAEHVRTRRAAQSPTFGRSSCGRASSSRCAD